MRWTKWNMCVTDKCPDRDPANKEGQTFIGRLTPLTQCPPLLQAQRKRIRVWNFFLAASTTVVWFYFLMFSDMAPLVGLQSFDLQGTENFIYENGTMVWPSLFLARRNPTFTVHSELQVLRHRFSQPCHHQTLFTMIKRIHLSIWKQKKSQLNQTNNCEFTQDKENEKKHFRSAHCIISATKSKNNDKMRKHRLVLPDTNPQIHTRWPMQCVSWLGWKNTHLTRDSQTWQ